MIRYKETYVDTDGNEIISSSGKSRAEIHTFEKVLKDEIYSTTVYLSKDAITIHMNDGSRYEYERSERNE